MQDKAQELLYYTSNKYQLVLSVARRAKTIRDDVTAVAAPDASKPIKVALRELAESQRIERESVGI